MNTNDVFLAAGDALRKTEVHPDDSPQIEIIKSLLYAKARQLLEFTKDYRKEYAEMNALLHRLNTLLHPDDVETTVRDQ